VTDRYVRVGLAEVRVSTDGTPLATSGLGSCLAIVAYTPDDVAGMLHAMIPEAPDEGPGDRPAKFVDTGVGLLLDRVGEAGDGRVRVKLAGGAKMFDFGSTDASVGERNAAAAARILSSRDVSVTGTDLGGAIGRSVVFDPTDAVLRIRGADGSTNRI